MNKKVVISAILLSLVALAYFFTYSTKAYTTGINKQDECKKHWAAPNEVANSLVDSPYKCRIIGKGPFQGAEFIHLKCNQPKGKSEDRFVFGSKIACGAFKELSSVEYIKLHLTTMLPPNKALKSGAPESGAP